MSSSLQTIILQLQQFWAEKGCLIGQPYYTQVGRRHHEPGHLFARARPRTLARRLRGTLRPPGRWSLWGEPQPLPTALPIPGHPQAGSRATRWNYLQSLEAIGINPREHDIRLVEDNWEQPAISAWGLGWEIWLDGQEITQFTYFQQVGGQSLDPVSVEITYGLDRILIALNNAAAIWDDALERHGQVRGCAPPGRV
jgi:glycyl-tRNA synthetase alpha subunit